MSATTHRPSIDRESCPRLRRWAGTWPAALVGLALLVGCYFLGRAGHDGPRRFWLSYTHNFAYFLSLGLGALFFVLLHHLTRAGWSVVVRRVAELLAMSLPMLAIAFIPIAANVLGGSGTIYRWARPLPKQGEAHAAGRFGLGIADFGFGDEDVSTGLKESKTAGGGTGGTEGTGGTGDAGVRHVLVADSPADVDAVASPEPHADGRAPSGQGDAQGAGPEDAHGAGDHGGLDALTLSKRPYLNGPFFVIRWGVYFAIWIGLAVYFYRRSVRQDTTGDPAATLSMQTLSAPGMLAFALAVTFASFDLLMSLDAHWFSTIFGVYFFSGAAIGFFALISLVLVLAQRRGLDLPVNAEHYHDLGKLLFAFVFFWGYIAFSQYMLIWYGNLPEETGWFVRRGCASGMANAWSPVIVIILIGQFIVPFVGLLSRHVKRRPGGLAFWAAWLLVMHWIDLYWLVMPELTGERLPLGVIELGTLAGLGLLFFAGLARFAAGVCLVPVGDPRLSESLAHHNV